MNPSLAERLQAAEASVAQARNLAAGGQMDEAEQGLAASGDSFETLCRELARPAPAAGPPLDPADSARARNVLPQVSLRALFDTVYPTLFSDADPAPNMRPFFTRYAAAPLTDEIVGLFRQEIDRQSAQARTCATDTEKCRARIEALEARVAVLSRFVFLFRVQCLAEAVRPADYAHTATAITGELRELGPLPDDGSTRSGRWREHERLFADLLARLPAPAAAVQNPPPTPQTQE